MTHSREASNALVSDVAVSASDPRRGAAADSEAVGTDTSGGGKTADSTESPQERKYREAMERARSQNAKTESHAARKINELVSENQTLKQQLAEREGSQNRLSAEVAELRGVVQTALRGELPAQDSLVRDPTAQKLATLERAILDVADRNARVYDPALTLALQTQQRTEQESAFRNRVKREYGTLPEEAVETAWSLLNEQNDAFSAAQLLGDARDALLVRVERDRAADAARVSGLEPGETTGRDLSRIDPKELPKTDWDAVRSGRISARDAMTQATMAILDKIGGNPATR